MYELGNFFQWSDLGLYLGLSPEDLKVIEVDHMQIRSRLNAVLLMWLKQEYNVDRFGLPSWSQLSDAVEPIDLALAITIKKRHVSEPQPQSKNNICICFVLIKFELE